MPCQHKYQKCIYCLPSFDNKIHRCFADYAERLETHLCEPEKCEKFENIDDLMAELDRLKKKI